MVVMVNVKEKLLSEYNKNGCDKFQSFNEFLVEKSFEIISNSSLFDEKYYVNCYPESIENYSNPIYHYLDSSNKNCNPNAFFDSEWYLNFYNNVKNSGLNPLVHYIVFGMDEGKFTSLSDFKFNNFNSISDAQIKDIMEGVNEKTSIIIPIYNAFTDLKRCIESVFNHSSIPFELILIDDNSTDVRISEFLESLKDLDNVKVIKNKENLGFVKNVNKGIISSKNDVILLNSDTIVTDKWLQKLTMVAYSNKRIGTVTPVSNNAGVFSVPVSGEDNIIPKYLGVDGMANIVEKSSKRIFMKVPTGNGFCMYIKRDAINSVGLFDDTNFGEGYGEENDFCMRCVSKGWINVIDDTTYIYHKKGASFSEKRERLIREHRKILDSKHPTYTNEVKKFLASQELSNIQSNTTYGLKNYFTQKFNKKRILYVLHNASGGTPQTNNDLMSVVEDYLDCYLLVSDKKNMKLYHYIDHNLQLVESYNLKSTWFAENIFIDEFGDVYFNILTYYSIDIVHIRHLINHTFDLPYICEKLGIPVCLSFHDFYFICPSYNLIDGNGDYCGGKCTKGNENCYIPLENFTNIPILKNFVKIWQKDINNLFKRVNCFITTSEVVKNIFLEIYPSINKENFQVIEHGRDFNVINDNLFEIPSVDKPIKILFIGNINFQKGSELIKSLYEIDNESKLEFHFLGKTIPELKKIGIHHGEYNRDELDKYIGKIKPSFIGIFSVWSETYCHTLTEAWSCGIPVLSTKFGVLEERVSKSEGGWFIDNENIKKSYNLILDVANNEEEYISKIKNIEKMEFKSIKEMTNGYLRVYENLLNCNLYSIHDYAKKYESIELLCNEDLLEELETISEELKFIIEESMELFNDLKLKVKHERKEKNLLKSKLKKEQIEKEKLINEINELKSFKGWISDKF